MLRGRDSWNVISTKWIEIRYLRGVLLVAQEEMMRLSRSALRSPIPLVRTARRPEQRAFLANATLVTVSFLFLAAVTFGLVS